MELESGSQNQRNKLPAAVVPTFTKNVKVVHPSQRHRNLQRRRHVPIKCWDSQAGSRACRDNDDHEFKPESRIGLVLGTALRPRRGGAALSRGSSTSAMSRHYAIDPT